MTAYLSSYFLSGKITTQTGYFSDNVKVGTYGNIRTTRPSPNINSQKHAGSRFDVSDPERITANPFSKPWLGRIIDSLRPTHGPHLPKPPHFIHERMAFFGIMKVGSVKVIRNRPAIDSASAQEMERSGLRNDSGSFRNISHPESVYRHRHIAVEGAVRRFEDALHAAVRIEPDFEGGFCMNSVIQDVRSGYMLGSAQNGLCEHNFKPAVVAGGGMMAVRSVHGDFRDCPVPGHDVVDERRRVNCRRTDSVSHAGVALRGLEQFPELARVHGFDRKARRIATVVRDEVLDGVPL